MSKILILGASGLVGSSLVEEFSRRGYKDILSPSHHELDLLRQEQTEMYFVKHLPEYVFMAAAKVGGIHANNTLRADFIFENLQIQQNIFHAAFKQRTPHLLFLGSSCIYPKNSPQPIKEEYLLTSALEPTNEPYAIAKIAGLKTVESFRKQYGLNWHSVMPTNLYGIKDNYDLLNSHVIPGLIARMHLAIKNNEPEFKIWGTGKAKREFLFVDDFASACFYFMMNYKGEKPDFINIGSGEDIEISELAFKISSKMGYKGKLLFDSTKPDGTPRKVLDVSKIKSMGWSPKTSLDIGLDIVIKKYLETK